MPSRNQKGINKLWFKHTSAIRLKTGRGQGLKVENEYVHGHFQALTLIPLVKWLPLEFSEKSINITKWLLVCFSVKIK
jgi:hypothetical protein